MISAHKGVDPVPLDVGDHQIGALPLVGDAFTVQQQAELGPLLGQPVVEVVDDLMAVGVVVAPSSAASRPAPRRRRIRLLAGRRLVPRRTHPGQRTRTG